MQNKREFRSLAHRLATIREQLTTAREDFPYAAELIGDCDVAGERLELLERMGRLDRDPGGVFAIGLALMHIGHEPENDAFYEEVFDCFYQYRRIMGLLDENG